MTTLSREMCHPIRSLRYIARRTKSGLLDSYYDFGPNQPNIYENSRTYCLCWTLAG